MNGSGLVSFRERWIGHVLGLTVCCLATVVVAGEPQSRFFDQLRSRQLFGLAERYCLEKLARADLPAAQRIDFAYELSRTFVQHALVAESEQQAELWDRAVQILEQTEQKVGPHERKVLLELQQGFVRCTQGQALRWQVALLPDDTVTRRRTMQLLQDGIERLTRLESELKVRLKKPPPKNAEPEDKFIPSEIRGLLVTTEYELGHAHFGLANLLASDSPDRLKTIQEAERWLEITLNSDRNGEAGHNSQVLLAGCARLRIEAIRGLRLLDDLEAETASSDPIRDQILAERARILLMQKKPVDAADLLTKALRLRPAPSGELISLRLQALTELWLTAEANHPGPVAADLRKTIDEQLQQVQVSHPGYWAIYCESLVTQARETYTLGPELARGVRAARGLYLSKQIPAAITAYDAASRDARAAGRDEVAYDLAYTKGSIEIESGRFQEANQTFDQLVANAPRNARNPDAHFLAAHALGKIYALHPTKANREAYTAKLEAQRQDYPDHSTSGEAAWLLGQLEEKRLQNSAAIRWYQQIPAGHSRSLAAGAATARCYDRLLQRLRDLKQPTGDWETEAIHRLSQLLPSTFSGMLTEDQAVLALHLANIVLQSSNPDFEETDRWLELVSRRAIAETNSSRGREQTPAATKSPWQEYNQAAAKLRVISLAGQQKFAEAEAALTGVAVSDPSELLSIIDSLSKLVAQAQEKPQHYLGELQLKVALSLKPQRGQLSPADQQRLDRSIAEAYVAAGRYEQALEVYRELLKAHPQDLKLLTGCALLLMKFDQRARTEEAQQLWKRLESQHKSGTVEWFQARYQLVRCELKIGGPDKALKLIGITKVLFPKLGGVESQRRFQALQEECQRAVQAGAK